MSTEDIPAPPRVYQPDQIVLYGIKLNKVSPNAALPFDKKHLFLEVTNAEGLMKPDKIAIVVAYGYSFEGHCYRFDRPKLFVFDRFDETENAVGCGFDGTGYTMWRIGSKQVLLELSTSVDLAETLVLDANLPGNQAPNTYGNKFQLAHRGGRLNRTGGPQY